MNEQDMLKLNIEWAKNFLALCLTIDCPKTVVIVKENIERMEKKLNGSM